MESWRNWLAQESYTLKVGSSSLSLSTINKEGQMDILLALYFVIGLIFGMERLSRVTKDDEHGIVSIGIMAIIVL